MMKKKILKSAILSALAFHAILASDQAPGASEHSAPHMLSFHSLASSTSQTSDDYMNKVTTHLTLVEGNLPYLSQAQLDEIINAESSEDQEASEVPRPQTPKHSNELSTIQSQTPKHSDEPPSLLSLAYKNAYINEWLSQVNTTASQSV